MSRRRSSLQHPLNGNEDQQTPDQNLLDADDKSPDEICQLTSWFERASWWFNAELGRTLFDDKVYETNKILPSVVSFILGLLLVKIYGDSLDSAITRCYDHLKNAFNSSYGLLTRLTSRDIEIVTFLCILVLLWIGALRILFNLARQLIQIPRNVTKNS